MRVQPVTRSNRLSIATSVCALFALTLVAAGVCVAQVRNLQPVEAAASAPAAASERRLALVIGNGSYRDAPLLNPVNDARAMSAALRDAGFTVIGRENAGHAEMLALIREFGDRLKTQGGVGLFYFAGHGVQIKGRNYLIPIGSQIEREDEVASQAVDASQVLDKMESAANRLNILILDACRNNPFARSFRSSQRGLAQMDAPLGTLVAFATAPGAVASDGDSGNGLYTSHLLRAMRQPDVKVEDVFKRVRTSVLRDSQRQQVPWEATSLVGDFYFHGSAELMASTASKARNDPSTATPLRGKPRLLVPGPAGSQTVLMQPGDGAFASAPMYAVGDEWEYTEQVLKGDTPPATRRIKVVEILTNGDTSLSTGEIRTPSGALVGGGPVGRSIAAAAVFPLAVGQRFDFMTPKFVTPDGTKNDPRKAQGVVEAIESVTTPAGTFHAFRIRVRLEFAGGGTVRVGETLHWYAPDVRRDVKQELRTWRASQTGPGPKDTTTLIELTKATLY